MRSGDEELALELQRTEEELHMYDGLARAMRDPHTILDAMLQAEDPGVARGALRERLDLAEVPAMGVLDLQFRRATRRERRRIEERRQELADRLAHLRDEA